MNPNSSLEIVGVVSNTKYGSSYERPDAVAYFSFAQWPVWDFNVYIRVAGAAETSLRTLKFLIVGIDHSVPFELKTICEATCFEFELRRFGFVLLGSVGGVGLLLAMIGLYGVMSYVVSSRMWEIGIRMAVKTSSQQVLVEML